MVMSWFDATQAKAFGVSLARYFIEKMPLESTDKQGRHAARTQQTLAKMQQQVEAFRQQHKPNLYKKARLGNAFKWTLGEAGYDSAYVDELTRWLMLRL